MSHDSFENCLSLEELWSGEMRGIEVGGRRVLLVRIENEVTAFEDRCPHLGVRLSEGRLEGCNLTCSAHEWTFDAMSGDGINPSRARLKSIPVEVHGGRIWVAREERAEQSSPQRGAL